MYSGCKIGVLDGESVYNCSESRSFRSMRERWWYIAVSRCSQPNEVCCAPKRKKTAAFIKEFFFSFFFFFFFFLQSCAEKFAVLNINNHQVISLNDSAAYPSSRFSGCRAFNRTDSEGRGGLYWNCTGSRTFRSARERWWFVATSRCSPATVFLVSSFRLVTVLLLASAHLSLSLSL